MAILQAEAACDSTLAVLTSIKASTNYSMYFEDPVPLPVGYVSKIDPQCVAAANEITSTLNAIKASGISTTITSVTEGYGAGESLILASTANTLESAAPGSNACFEKWCDGIVVLSSGSFLNTTRSNLQTALSTVLSLTDLRTLLKTQSLSLLTIQTAAESVKRIIANYPPEVKQIMTQIGIVNVAVGNEAYKNKLGAMNEIHQSTNPKVAQAYSSIPADNVERTQQELRNVAVTNLLGLGFAANVTNYVSSLTTNINILNG